MQKFCRTHRQYYDVEAGEVDEGCSECILKAATEANKHKSPVRKRSSVPRGRKGRSQKPARPVLRIGEFSLETVRELLRTGRMRLRRWSWSLNEAEYRDLRKREEHLLKERARTHQ